MDWIRVRVQLIVCWAGKTFVHGYGHQWRGGVVTFTVVAFTIEFRFVRVGIAADAAIHRLVRFHGAELERRLVTTVRDTETWARIRSPSFIGAGGSDGELIG